jgi:hypothetical protein
VSTPWHGSRPTWQSRPTTTGELLAALRRAAFAQALSDLPERHRELMQALAAEPAPS